MTVAMFVLALLVLVSRLGWVIVDDRRVMDAFENVESLTALALAIVAAVNFSL